MTVKMCIFIICIEGSECSGEDLHLDKAYISTPVSECSRVLFHSTSMPHCLQPRNYQIRKQVVHEIEFGDVAVMQI